MTMRRKLKALLADRRATVIAQRAGIHPVTLSSYVARGAMPSAGVAVSLADALGVDVGWLIDDRQGWPPILSKNPTVPPAPIQTAAA